MAKVSFRNTVALAAPERLSDVTAEDILPLLPRNLSSFIPLLRKLEGEKCQRHGEHFLQGLHNLTKWAVQSKWKFSIIKSHYRTC